jgi:hypothetical protein
MPLLRPTIDASSLAESPAVMDAAASVELESAKTSGNDGGER